MSGHSKFANIKHKKEKNDAKKGKIFTVIGRELVMAVKAGGPDPNNNSKLRDVIAKAKANNMPNDTIERGIKKAAGADSADNYEKAVYEGYGPNGVAIIVETLTDNKNRTAGNVRNAFTKGNGSIGTQGCVSYMFDQKGQIIIDKEECEMDADEIMMLALDAGAEDFSEEDFLRNEERVVMRYNSVLDLHTHTLVSGHAYCSLREMAKAAADKGLEVLGITEHAPAMPGTCHKYYFENLKIVPREMYGIQLLLGSEVNILDAQGTVDLVQRTLERMSAYAMHEAGI